MHLVRIHKTIIFDIETGAIYRFKPGDPDVQNARADTYYCDCVTGITPAGKSWESEADIDGEIEDFAAQIKSANLRSKRFWEYLVNLCKADFSK